MEFGFTLLQFLNSPERPVAQQAEDTAAAVRKASSLGFRWIAMGEHWASHPSVWAQPFPVLARFSAEAAPMRLLTQAILLPLHNPLHLAEEVATLDHLCGGRLIFGVGLGYRDVELEAVGASRKERVSRLEECLEVMGRLWTGDEVTHRGRHFHLTEARMGFTPLQRPRPPLWIAAQSTAAAARAGRLGDALFLGPQQTWADQRPLVEAFQQAWQEAGKPGRGLVAGSRALIVARTRGDALRDGRAYMERTFSMYQRFGMQERGTVEFQLSLERDPAEWAIFGSPQECVEILSKAREELGMTHVSFGFYNLPAERSARLEYVQFVAEEVVRPLASS